MTTEPTEQAIRICEEQDHAPWTEITDIDLMKRMAMCYCGAKRYEVIPMADLKLMRTTDASKWAREFVHHVKQNPEIATDEATMLAWFDAAIDSALRLSKEGLIG